MHERTLERKQQEKREGVFCFGHCVYTAYVYSRRQRNGEPITTSLSRLEARISESRESCCCCCCCC
ncbi:hypothetical protein WN48_01017 [Eufriesea mexicana]|nr:hypothetical protein WN48_01017 [Eufriesea mexicana]